MKALASNSPAFATVGISERSARRHYGINSGFEYDPLQHGNARKIWDACSGFNRTYMMVWFIEKVPFRNGHAILRYLDQTYEREQSNPVKENKPIKLNYQQKRRVSSGPFTTISTAIYYSSDPQNLGAPKYVEDGTSSNTSFPRCGLRFSTDGVTHLVNVEADLSRVPAKKIPQTKGQDGKMYYEVDYAIQVTCMSAYTTYELIHGGKNYGLVSAEYV